jgi:hypothetical protein
MSSQNPGITAQDRAKNYAATNAFNVAGIAEDAIQRHMQLDQVEVVRSPI